MFDLIHWFHDKSLIFIGDRSAVGLDIEVVVEMEDIDIDNERREAAIASAASLQSNFKPKGGVSSAQLSKFQELHKRRLQLKTRSKPKKKSKGLIDEFGTTEKKNLSVKECTDIRLSSRNEETSTSFPHDVSSYSHQEKGESFPVPKERKKLHWGLDTKERWEMKANM